MRYTCKNCNSEIDIKFFFDDVRITNHQYIPGGHIDYIAHAKGTAICYQCGTQLKESFDTILHERDIIKLAIQEENP